MMILGSILESLLAPSLLQLPGICPGVPGGARRCPGVPPETVSEMQCETPSLAQWPR